MTDDQQQAAEATDSDELGEDVTGELQFPPDHAVGVDDPTQDDHNLESFRDRSLREEPERVLGDEAETTGRLQSTTELLLDDEGEAIAMWTEAGDLSAEEAAIHVTDG